MIKLMITGSCGFLMGNLIRKIIYDKQLYQVTSLDKISEYTANSVYWNKNHTFHIADIRDKYILNSIFKLEEPDIVIHGAAETKEQDHYISSNIQGTQNIIDVSLKHKVKKLIFISSSEVYGPNAGYKWKEENTTNPISLEAVSKLSGELLVKTSGLTYNIVRLTNSYGPYQMSSAFFPKIIKSVSANETFTILNNNLTKDWTHVFDHYSGIMTVLKNGKDNEIYNIAANQEFTEIEVAYKICNVLSKGHDLVKFDNKTDFEFNLDTTKIKEIGWKPQYKFKDGVNLCVNWYLNNQWILK